MGSYFGDIEGDADERGSSWFANERVLAVVVTDCDSRSVKHKT